MNQKLRETLEDYYNIIKESRPNYRTCYNSFLEYCDTHYSQYSLKELFEKHLDILDIKKACKHYIETSKKATSIEAVQRFLLPFTADQYLIFKEVSLGLLFLLA